MGRSSIDLPIYLDIYGQATYSPLGHKELDMTEVTSHTHTHTHRSIVDLQYCLNFWYTAR